MAENCRSSSMALARPRSAITRRELRRAALRLDELLDQQVHVKRLGRLAELSQPHVRH